MTMQRIAQGLRRHDAEKTLACVQHIGVVAVGIFKQTQRRAAATVVVLGDHGKCLTRDVGGLEHGGRIHAAHELANVVVGGAAQNLVGRADLHDMAVLHDRDVVADAHGLVQIVRDEDDGAALDLLKAQQLRLHFGADDGIERGEGFVHQQNRRIGRKRARQTHALLHAARKLIGIARAPCAKAYLFERFLRGALALGTVDAGEFKAERGVVEHRHVRHQGEGLEHHRDVLAAQCSQVPIAQCIDVLALDQNAARRGFDQPVEHAHQRRFARARQTHDDEDLARFDGEVGIEHADGLARAGKNVLLAQALLDKGERGFRIFSEYLEHMIDDDLFGHVVVPPDGGPLSGEGRRMVELTPVANCDQGTKTEMTAMPELKRHCLKPRFPDAED